MEVLGGRYRGIRPHLVDPNNHNTGGGNPSTRHPEKGKTKMEKLNITNIYDLLHMLFDDLGVDFAAEVINGAFPDDTIKVTRKGSTNAMYIGFDTEYTTVIDAAVYDEPEGYHDRGDWPIAEGIYWDTEDESITPETIAADIAKQF